jgi:glycosyltransferase involved in cell wall biosynthesis
MDSASLPSAGVTVSVCMITYNHEAYIAQAIEGVLMQQSTFPVELVIGEDCSTDRTREIVQGYAGRYPGKIRLLLNEHNLGSQANFIATLEACSAKYVALCEGDDYWTDPLKLQKQVDFLENHSDYAFCFHLTYKLYQATGEMALDEDRVKKPYYIIDDILTAKSGISTVSVIFRNSLIQSFPTWFYKSPVGDTPLFVLLAQHGKIGFIEQPMAIYRIHDKGIWQGADGLVRVQMAIKTHTLLQTYLGKKYEKKFNILFSNLYLNEARLMAERGDYANSKFYFKKSIQSSSSLKGTWIDKLVMLGILYFPKIYKFSKWILGRAQNSSSSS